MDRYKASSLRSYNDRLPERYDDRLLARVFPVGVMDEFVLAELRGELPSLRILDVGCATGRLLGRLAAAGGRQLAGSDLAPRIIEVARAKLATTCGEVELQSADAETALPWPSSRFDAVTLTGVLHHFSRPAAALAEIRRVLRPDGRLILVDPCFLVPLRLIFNLALRIHPHEGDYRFYSAAAAGRLLEQGGFEVLERLRLNWCFYGIVGMKMGHA
jgi:SAM-dependent methyltransferase